MALVALAAGDEGRRRFVVAERVRVELDRVYEFWVGHRAELLAMPRRFSSVKAGMPLAAEPEELVSALLGKFVDWIARLDSDEQLEERSAKAQDLGYIYRALENLNTDFARLGRREAPVAPEVLGELGEEPSTEEDAEQDRSASDLQRLRAIIGVLRSRGEGPSSALTCLTPLHIASWRAVEEGHGAQAELAREWGVHPSRISQVKRSARAKFCETVYVAGVLGPRRGLDDPPSIGACLDVYDSSAESHTHMTPADRVRLSTAAGAVTITEHRGQRVEARRAAELFLRRKDKKTLRDQVAGAGASAFDAFVTVFTDELHQAESLQARGAGVEDPNCVAVCARHNPTGTDRVIWDVEMCHD